MSSGPPTIRPTASAAAAACARFPRARWEKEGLTVEKEMPQAGVWTDPKTNMEYFVHFPGADKGFRNNPGKDWVESGLDMKKCPEGEQGKL